MTKKIKKGDLLEKLSNAIDNLGNMSLGYDIQTDDFRRDTITRITTVLEELMSGYKFINEHENIIPIFGSARFTEEHPYYQKAKQLGQMLAEEGYTILTGGGPGIMEAANLGASLVKNQHTLAVGIELEKEQKINKFATLSINQTYFFVRKSINH